MTSARRESTQSSFFDRLTVRTVAVAAGIVVEFPVAAVGTDAYVHAEAAGAAGKDSL